MAREFGDETAAGWHKRQRLNLALTVNAFLVRRSLTLSHLAQHFPVPVQPRLRRVKHGLWHRLMRLRRFLSNPRLDMAPVYARLTYLALAVSDAPRLPVLVDLTYMRPYALLVAC